MTLKLRKWAFSTTVLVSLCLTGCSEEPEIKPALHVSEPSRVISNHTYFSVKANISKLGSKEITSFGFTCSKNRTPDVSNGIVLEYDALYGDYFYGELKCPPLLPNNTYYVRAFVKTGDDIYYSDNIVSYHTPTGTWTKLTDFPGAHRTSSLTFSANGKAYLLGGKNLEGSKFSDLWCYNPDNDEWVQKASFPSTVYSEVAGVFVINNIPYVVEANGSSFAGLYSYDQQNDQWNKIGDGIEKQTRIIAFSISGMGYAGSGHFDGYFYEYNPQTNVWTSKRKYPGEAMYQSYSGSVQSSQLGFAGFGQEWPSNNYVNEFYEYNPTTNEWIERYSFLDFDDYLKGMICFATTSKIYFGMGRNINDADFATLYEYSSNYGWVEVNSLPGTERSNAVAFAIGSTGYVGLGLKYHHEGQVDKLKDFWKFTP